jgi:hypothetical protein
VFTSVKKGGPMNQGKPRTSTTMANLGLYPLQAAAVPAGPRARSSQAAITHDLYSYRRYKHWMNNLRPSRDEISRDTEVR